MRRALKLLDPQPGECIADLFCGLGNFTLPIARSGAQVVRLKSGDATVFGRLDEEIDAVSAERISWDIVPGITSAPAAVAAIGQSLTKRERNSSVRFLTGHDMKGFADHDWAALARSGLTLVIYMGVARLPFIVRALGDAGLGADTPAARPASGL